MEARRVVLGAGVACVTVLVFVLLFAAGLTALLAMLVAALIGGATASVAARPLTPALPPSLPAEPDEVVRLRHDLRGVLSPALLTADRLLASSDDPLVRRAAETMIETVERATALLARPAARDMP